MKLGFTSVRLGELNFQLPKRGDEYTIKLTPLKLLSSNKERTEIQFELEVSYYIDIVYKEMDYGSFIAILSMEGRFLFSTPEIMIASLNGKEVELTKRTRIVVDNYNLDQLNPLSRTLPMKTLHQIYEYYNSKLEMNDEFLKTMFKDVKYNISLLDNRITVVTQECE